MEAQLNPKISKAHLRKAREMLSKVRRALEKGSVIKFSGYLEMEVISEALKALLEKHENEGIHNGMLFKRYAGSNPIWNGWDIPKHDRKYRGWVVFALGADGKPGKEIVRIEPSEDEPNFSEAQSLVEQHLKQCEVDGSIAF